MTMLGIELREEDDMTAATAGGVMEYVVVALLAIGGGWALAAGLLLEQTWLLVFGAVVLAEELYETSVLVLVLRMADDATSGARSPPAARCRDRETRRWRSRTPRRDRGSRCARPRACRGRGPRRPAPPVRAPRSSCGRGRSGSRRSDRS